MATKREIIDAIDAHITKEGSGYRAWYVGITNDPDRRLFDEHGVPRGKGKAWWIHREAETDDAARSVERRFHEKGCEGGGGGGDDDCRSVYAYKMTDHTDP